MSTSGDASRPPPPTAIVCKPCAAAPPVPPRPAPSARYDGAATRVEAATARLRAVVQAAPFDADARVNAHRVGLAATYQQAARIDYALAARARLRIWRRSASSSPSPFSRTRARDVGTARSVADSAGRADRRRRGQELRGAALDVAAACDAIVAAQRKLVLEAESYDEALFDLEPVDVGSVAVDGDEGEVDDFVASVVQLDAKYGASLRKRTDLPRRGRRVGCTQAETAAVCATISSAADVALKRQLKRRRRRGVGARAELARLLALLRGRSPTACVEKRRPTPSTRSRRHTGIPDCRGASRRSRPLLKQSTCLELLENGARARAARGATARPSSISTIFATEAGLAEAAADARDAALQTLANEVRDAAASQVRRLDDFGKSERRGGVSSARRGRRDGGTALEEVRLEAQRRAADLAHARVRAATSSQITDDELRRALKPKQWFAPLRDVLKALTDAKAARVDGAAFDDLARLAVSGVVAQLSEAQRRLAAFKAPPLELQLFAVAHLLVLREKVAPLGARLGPGVVAKKRPRSARRRPALRAAAPEQLDDARAIDEETSRARARARARASSRCRALAGPYVDARGPCGPLLGVAGRRGARATARVQGRARGPARGAGAARAAADAAATDEALRHVPAPRAAARRAAAARVAEGVQNGDCTWPCAPRCCRLTVSLRRTGAARRSRTPRRRGPDPMPSE